MRSVHRTHDRRRTQKRSVRRACATSMSRSGGGGRDRASPCAACRSTSCPRRDRRARRRVGLGQERARLDPARAAAAATRRPRSTGSALVDGVDMVLGAARSAGSCARDHLGAVFQDPMTSLNPTMRVGRQVAEAAGSSEPKRSGCSTRSASPSRRGGLRSLPARALGRAAPTRDDRDGDRRRARRSSSPTSRRPRST